MLNGLSGCAVPALFLISETDLVAAEFTSLCTSDAKWKAAMARPSIRVETLVNADHTFSNRPALIAATELCIAWIAGRVAHERDAVVGGMR